MRAGRRGGSVGFGRSCGGDDFVGYRCGKSNEAVPDAAASVDVEKTAVPPHDQNARPGLRTSDRRTEIRKRVLKRGQIVVPSLGAVVDCTVRNLSIGGAAVRIDEPFAPPPEFDLAIAG
jgi:hypothetical protein